MSLSGEDERKCHIYIAECLAVRATCFLNLIRYFGDVPYSTAVSYTHLDVYKRQPPNVRSYKAAAWLVQRVGGSLCMHISLSLICFLPFIFSLLYAVSYTHLDVYKRQA